eukprot:6028061-Pleurochrysis_carterae.AAC.1
MPLRTQRALPTSSDRDFESATRRYDVGVAHAARFAFVALSQLVPPLTAVAMPVRASTVATFYIVLRPGARWSFRLFVARVSQRVATFAALGW